MPADRWSDFVLGAGSWHPQATLAQRGARCHATFYKGLSATVRDNVDGLLKLGTVRMIFVTNPS